MSLAGSFTLSLEGCDAALQVRSLRGHEAIAQPYRVELTVGLLSGEALDPEALLGTRAELELVHESDPRILIGLVDQIDQTMAGYHIVLVPRIAMLADAVDHRVFLGQSAVEIVEHVLRAHGLEVEQRLSETPEPRAQCVQAFESNLAFVDRLLSEEGIRWHLEYGSGTDVVVLSDHAGASPAMIGGELLELREGEAAGLRGSEHVFAAALEQRTVIDEMSLCDFDFEKADLDLRQSAGDGPIEVFEYDAGYLEVARGQRLASQRLEQAQAERTVLRGKTNCRRMGAGSTFELQGTERDDMAGRWLVLELEHEGIDFGAAASQSEQRYQARFVAVPAEGPYRSPRPERAASQPSLGGLQTATVTGPAGAEIHTEAHGRVKVLHRWDRIHAADDGSSHWVRPVQPPTSGGLFLPRTGWEVLVDFQGKSGDQPFVLGRVYNGQATPPEGLPAQKVRSAFGSQTSPGGGGANVLRMDDAGGHEGMLLQCSLALNERTENDKGCAVEGSEDNTVGGDHTYAVGILKAVTVHGAQDYSIGGNRELTTTGNLGIEAASENVSVGAVRTIQVGGDYETQAATLTRAVGAAKAIVAIQEANRHVSGVATVVVGGGWSEIGGLASSQSVLGASVLHAGPASIKASNYSLKASVLKETYGTKSATAGAKRVDGFGGMARYSVAGSMGLKGSNVFFKADSKITVQAGGATIIITPGAIKIKGDLKCSDASVVTGDEEVG